MKNFSRRSFLSVSTSTVGVISGCGTSAPESPVLAKPVTGSFIHLLEGIGRENIKITDVRITQLSYTPSDGKLVEEDGPVIIPSRGCTILEMFTDHGIVGIGPGERGMKDYSNLIGKNPFDVELLGISAGLDIACWDIIGKAKGLPVYKLLATDNEPNPSVHVYASGGVSWTFYDKGDGTSYGTNALIEEALKYKELGFDTFKWRPGTDWEEADMTAEKLGNTVCRKLREAVGPNFKLGLEKKAYDTWTFEECIAIAPIINELNFFFFEQPMGDIGPEAFEDYLKIKELMPNVMLWGGESFRNRAQARPWMEQGIYEAVQSDSIRVGITENWYIARIADFYGTNMVTHNWTTGLGTMCNMHLIAGVPSGYMCEFFMYENTPWRYGLFKEPMVPENGYITLKDKPGFGMELINIEELKKMYPYDPNERGAIPNPRFPHAYKRARVRGQKIRSKYLR